MANPYYKGITGSEMYWLILYFLNENLSLCRLCSLSIYSISLLYDSCKEAYFFRLPLSVIHHDHIFLDRTFWGCSAALSKYKPWILVCHGSHGLRVLSCPAPAEELCKLGDCTSKPLVIHSAGVHVALHDESARMKLAIRVHLMLIEAVTHSFAFSLPTKNI